MVRGFASESKSIQKTFNTTQMVDRMLCVSGLSSKTPGLIPKSGSACTWRGSESELNLVAAHTCGAHDFRGSDRLADMALSVIGDVHQQAGDGRGHLLAANRSLSNKCFR